MEQGRWRIRADLDRTDSLFVSRLIRIEDSRFDVHRGVDPFAVARANSFSVADSPSASSGP